MPCLLFFSREARKLMIVFGHPVRNGQPDWHVSPQIFDVRQRFRGLGAIPPLQDLVPTDRRVAVGQFSLRTDY